MRTLVVREERDSRSLRFLYHTSLGGLVLKLITRRWVSRAAGRYLDSRLSRHKIKKYVKKHKIDMSQYLPETYGSFNAFFTRRIRPELRPFDEAADAFVSPCDGKLTVFPASKEGRFEVKGYSYTVAELLKNEALAKKYEGGLVIVLRLCVEDYHRYFYLDSGEKEENVFIKGRLHTVQPIALEHRRVFTENCREYTVMHTERFGDVTQVEVGALMVGRIVNHDGAGRFEFGKEKGKFEFGGSTIVLLVEKDKIELDEEFFANTAKNAETVVKCGERIGKKL